jgi:phosphomannomutase
MQKSIFRAYDIRGIYPSEINEEVVLEIGKALGKYFSKGGIVIGHDCRLSSPSLYEMLIKGFNNEKFAIHKVGLITTPMLYFLVNNLKASGGVMVTASHNPKEYNGLKVVGEDAVSIKGEEVYKLISRV